MITASEREQLRERAVAAWLQAKRLHRDAETLVGHARDLRASHNRGAVAAAGIWAGPDTVADGLEPMWAVDGPYELQALVDRALARSDVGDDDLDDRCVGLVASGDMSQLLWLGELVGSAGTRVLGARDAGTALGLSIANQPDLAVIDERLEVASGVDLALTLGVFTPRTTMLLLSDDSDTARKAELAGVTVLPHEVSPRELRAWAVAALA